MIERKGGADRSRPNYSSEFPFLGFGVGLRHKHFDDVLRKQYRDISWVEAITENFLPWEDEIYRKPISVLEKIREDLPVALHGVSLSIGSADPLNHKYLRRLKSLAQRISPCWISDHLCWTGVDGQNLHDLLPLPYTEEAVEWIADRVMQVQEFLGRRILLENVSSYVEFADSEMAEWEFVGEIAKRADCGLLLDVNNVYVSSKNHAFDPFEYLKTIPWERVGQIHLAGHTNKGTHLIDTHDEPVCDDVWDLYRWVVQNCEPVSAMVEWDDQIPEWTVLEDEVRKAKRVWQEARPYERSQCTSQPSATV